MRHTRRFALALALVTSLSLPRAVFAGNDEGILFGSDAVLTAGAVTATTAEGAALWYNPAGLAAAPSGSLDVTGDVLQVRRYAAPGYLRSGARATDVSFGELNVIPSSESYVRRLSSRVQLGFGLFVPRTTDLDLRTSHDAAGARWTQTRNVRAESLAFGVGVGVTLSPALRVGAGLFAVYESAGTTEQTLGMDPMGGASTPFWSRASTETVDGLHLEPSVGVQWRAHRRVRLGLAVRGGGVRVFESRETTGATLAYDGATARATPLAGAVESGVAVVSPWRVRAGAAVDLGAWTVALDGDVAFAQPDAPAPRAFVWNARLGATLRASDTLSFGAGVFTDRSATRALAAPPPMAFDYYGATLGARFGDVHRLVGEQPDRLAFVTAVAVRYAYGVGEVAGVVTPEGAAGEARAQRVAATAHEVGLNVTSTLQF